MALKLQSLYWCGFPGAVEAVFRKFEPLPWQLCAGIIQALHLKKGHEMNTDPTQPMRILRLPQLLELTGLSRATVYAKSNPGHGQYDAAFPKRVRLNGTRRGAVGWIEAEVLKWMLHCIEHRQVSSS